MTCTVSHVDSKATLPCLESEGSDGAMSLESSKAWSSGMRPASLCNDTSMEQEAVGLRQRKVAFDPINGAAGPAAAAPSAEQADTPNIWASRCRTLLAIAYLWACAPLLVFMAGLAWFRHHVFGSSF